MHFLAEFSVFGNIINTCIQPTKASIYNYTELTGQNPVCSGWCWESMIEPPHQDEKSLYQSVE